MHNQKAFEGVGQLVSSRGNVNHVLYAPLGVHLRQHAWRKNVSGIVQAPLPLFWGVSKSA
jgi:peptide/nickel transport system substrate-binding protein